MRGACIDIGSNTTRLLVGDFAGDGVAKVDQRRAFTHLRRRVAADGTIDAQTVQELAAVVAEQLEVARALGAQRVALVATAAVRRAGNVAEVAAALARHCGVELRVLSELEEAHMAFCGACAAVGAAGADCELGVIDVGGASSELVVGRAPDRVRWSQSRQVGSGTLADTCFHGDPPTEPEIEAARRRVAGVLGELAVPRPDRAVAVGGSAASLRPLAGPCLDEAAFAAALDLLVAAPAPEVARAFGLDVERVRLLPAGLLVLEAAQQRFGVPLEIVDGGLREGVLMELCRG